MVGLDNDVHGLNAAERNFKALGINYKRLKIWKDTNKKDNYLLQGDAQNLPFRSDFFDKVIMSEVAEHLEDDLKGVKEARRVLKPGGKIILTVPNKYYPFLWDPVNWLGEHLLGFHFKKGFLAGIWNQHIRLYTPNQIEDVIQKAGFKIEKREIQTKWCLPFNHYLINLGARALAAGILPQELHQQANKFNVTTQKRSSFLIKLYYFLANMMDSLNRYDYVGDVGTTIFIKARR